MGTDTLTGQLSRQLLTTRSVDPEIVSVPIFLPVWAGRDAALARVFPIGPN